MLSQFFEMATRTKMEAVTITQTDLGWDNVMVLYVIFLNYKSNINSYIKHFMESQ